LKLASSSTPASAAPNPSACGDFFHPGAWLNR
jgi:hypothetical protein